LICVFVLAVSNVASAQIALVQHFVSPSYPPLARQTMISGQVQLEVRVDKSGVVIDAAEVSPANRVPALSSPVNPILAQGSKDCVREWTFQATGREVKAFVIFYYGFSGNTRETNPSTSVKADFDGVFTRVFITTDAMPPHQP
jgi:hypothetical protein